MLARFSATAAVAAALAAGGCKKDKAKPPETTAPVEASAAAACEGAERERGTIAWFHDDYGKALGCAKAKHVPLVIDMWAPWCHTCLSMQAYILTDAKLDDAAHRFVFLALDTDKDVNAAPVKKFPPAAWPTFFVVSPTDESVQSRFVGSTSAEQFAAFLADGERGFAASAGVPLAAWDAKAREGDQAASAQNWAGAAAAYQAALAAAPKGWVRTPDVLVSLASTRARGKNWRGCLEVGRDRLADTGATASTSDLSYHLLSCASELEAAQPSPDDKQLAATVRQAVITRLTALTADPVAALSVDDRSDALANLREGLDGLGQKDAAKQAALTQRKLLDDAAAAAKTPLDASTYNWPRSEVYLYLGVPLELVPALEKSAGELPEEYDPPYRLAWIYWKAGKLDDAKVWIGKALGRVYGPRKTRALAMLADIEKARGDVEAERKARQGIVDAWLALPAEAQVPEAIEKARADLAAVGAAGSGSGSGAGSAKAAGSGAGKAKAAGSGSAH